MKVDRVFTSQSGVGQVVFLPKEAPASRLLPPGFSAISTFFPFILEDEGVQGEGTRGQNSLTCFRPSGILANLLPRWSGMEEGSMAGKGSFWKCVPFPGGAPSCTESK